MSLPAAYKKAMEARAAKQAAASPAPGTGKPKQPVKDKDRVGPMGRITEIDATPLDFDVSPGAIGWEK